MNEILLLPRFHEQIRLHLVANFLDIPVRPIVLGIFGRSGDGKSAQLAAALEAFHVDPYRISAGDLESGMAGEPGKLVARTYSAASLAIEKNSPAALVIEDIDTTVGEWELNTGTVNHQQVIAELMHLADRPTDSLRNCPCRVPVFVTGNNLSRLYPPLRRHGRMHVMPWRPNPAELLSVVVGLFRGIASEQACEVLAAEFAEQPLAFFAQVRQAVLEAGIGRQLSAVDPDMRVLLRRRGGRSHAFSHSRIADHDLLRMARKTRDDLDTGLQNFLAETSGELR
jgi:hypothetical protein